MIWWHDGEATRLFNAIDAEGVASDGYRLYVVEDRGGQGRLLRYDPNGDPNGDSNEGPDQGALTALRDGLDEAEGIAVCPNGKLYTVEKSRGSVRLMISDGTDQDVVTGLNRPGFVACGPEGLWITEDATHGARLLLLDQQSKLQVILTHLRAPQTLLAIAPNRYLLAEQGRDRILEIWRDPTNIESSQP